MDEIQTAAWRAGLLLLLDFLKGEICDVTSGNIFADIHRANLYYPIEPMAAP
jgi:hypothetical protein